MDVRSDELVQRFDLKTTHEEAYVIIHQHMMALTDIGCKTINVICGDPDVCILLDHYFAEESLSASLIMESTNRSRSSIEIGATVANTRASFHNKYRLQLMQFPDVTQLSEGPSVAYCPVSLPSKVEVAPSYILYLG